MGEPDVIGISVNTRLSAAAYRALRERAPVAIMRGLNKSGASGRSALVKAVAGDLGIKQATIREKVFEQLASVTKLVYRLSVSGKRIPLYEFKAKGRFPSRGKGTGVTAKLPGGSGRYQHAFIARMKSGHVGVFQRVANAKRRGAAPNRSQLPIYELFGPSLPKVVGKLAGVFFARSREVLSKNVQHEINFETSQIRKSTAA